ncbi:TadE/TadG family type IV pilus assembly protein [Kitasatospora sp. NBC_01266]|uniref:TadE/TadG family type IV pilus assembly protein n=1 Tax=Kitasatospora sp. NBC_01266 TaxID=2903572 RepID=UPI002E34970A|nr:TadE/TadG family type IV pilus assembly protein [Kitasatospora sp. NBC_01266]
MVTNSSADKQRRRPGDQGSASPELVIATSLLLLLLMAIVQFALASHAHHIAQAAAAQAVAAARTQNADTATGQRAGEELLRQIDSASLQQTSVIVERTATTATAEVHGHVIELLPYLRLDVSAHAAGPVEQLTGPAADG